MLLLAIRNMDAAEYMTPYQPRPDDIWERWSFAPEAPEVANAVVEPPWWERHHISPPHTIYKMQDIADLEPSGLWKLK